MKIEQLSLRNFTNSHSINRREFYFGSVNGFAEIIGYHIIFFKDQENLDETSVISIDLDDVHENELLKEMGNSILENLKLSFRFDDNKEKVVSQFGQPLYTDDILEKIEICYYKVNNDCFVSIGIHEINGICSFEIICNRKIIKERIEYLKNM